MRFLRAIPVVEYVKLGFGSVGLAAGIGLAALTDSFDWTLLGWLGVGLVLTSLWEVEKVRQRLLTEKEARPRRRR